MRPLVLDDVELFARCSVLVVGDAAHYEDFICSVVDDATGVGPILLHRRHFEKRELGQVFWVQLVLSNLVQRFEAGTSFLLSADDEKLILLRDNQAELEDF